MGGPDYSFADLADEAEALMVGKQYETVFELLEDLRSELKARGWKK